MKTNTTRFSSVLLLLLPILVFASADTGYGKTQLKGYMAPKPDTPKESYPKLPTPKPVVPRYVSYKKSYDPKTPAFPKPMIPKEEYKKSYDPKTPTISKPVLPKGEYKKSYDPKTPTVTKPVLPKGEYKKSYDPKTPTVTKPVLPKGEYKKSYDPKTPTVTKPVLPKGEYKKSYDPKTPTVTKPVLPKGEYKKSYEPKTPTVTKPVLPKGENKKSYDPKTPTIKKPVVEPKQEEHAAYYGKGYDPKMPTPKKELLPKVPEHQKNIAVQGLIYCKYGSKLIPLQGATARVTCLAVRKNGYESAPFSFSSSPADDKGYFLAKISASKILKHEDLWEITECKAFLEYSPWAACKVPGDTNGGIRGSHLTYNRMLNGYRLSSVGPFIYNPGHESLPNEGY